MFIVPPSLSAEQGGGKPSGVGEAERGGGKQLVFMLVPTYSPDFLTAIFLHCREIQTFQNFKYKQLLNNIMVYIKSNIVIYMKTDCFLATESMDVINFAL